MVNRLSGEIVLLYREGTEYSAEVYKFHDGCFKVATHFNAAGVNPEFIDDCLSRSTIFEGDKVATAVRFFSSFRKERVNICPLAISKV